MLLRASVRLGEERRSRIDEATHAALSAAFEKQVGASWAPRLRRSGEILVSAVADEAGGIAAAVPSLLPWFTDPARFPAEWTSAVLDTIHEARARATKR